MPVTVKDFTSPAKISVDKLTEIKEDSEAFTGKTGKTTN